MVWLIDTSVAVKWAVTEPGWEPARELLSEPVVAPDLLRAELAQALFKKVRRQELTPAAALAAQADIEALLSFLPWTHLSARALELSLELMHPAGDCFFLAMAEELGLPFVTADIAFVERCRATPYCGLVRSLR